jgi:hypothetical protein
MSKVVSLVDYKEKKRLKNVKVIKGGCFFWGQTDNTCLHKFFNGHNDGTCDLDDCPRRPKKEK